MPWFTLKDHTILINIPIIPQVFELFLQVFKSPSINEQNEEKEEKEEETDEKAREKAENQNAEIVDVMTVTSFMTTVTTQPMTIATGPWQASRGHNMHFETVSHRHPNVPKFSPTAWLPRDSSFN